MKLKWIVLSGATGVLAVLLACILSTHGSDAVAATPFIALSSVPVPEFPAKAADLVHDAAAPDRAQTTREVMRAALSLARPGVLPYIVSAVCRANPETAGTAVASAIELQPQDVLIFSRAAACAAPEQAGQIVSSACKSAPSEFINVTLVVSQQLPSANDAVLQGLADGLPGLKDLLKRAEVQCGTNDPATVLGQAFQLFNNPAGAQTK